MVTSYVLKKLLKFQSFGRAVAPDTGRFGFWSCHICTLKCFFLSINYRLNVNFWKWWRKKGSVNGPFTKSFWSMQQMINLNQNQSLFFSNYNYLPRSPSLNPTKRRKSIFIFAKDFFVPIPVWPDVGVKSSPIFPKVAQKVANSVFT